MPFIVTAVTAVAGAIGGVLAAGGIGAALIRIGGTLLLSYAAQALMPKPQMTMQARTVTVREPVMPRDLVYGRTRKGGVIVFLHALAVAGCDVWLVVVVEEVGLNLAGKIFCVEASVVEPIQNVFVKETTASEDDDAVQVTGFLAV
jgi:hypothetical protein